MFLHAVWNAGCFKCVYHDPFLGNEEKEHKCGLFIKNKMALTGHCRLELYVERGSGHHELTYYTLASPSGQHLQVEMPQYEDTEGNSGHSAHKNDLKTIKRSF